MKRALRFAAVPAALLISTVCSAQDAASTAPAPQAATQAELARLSQELLDAVTDGKPDVWRRILDPQALVTDEDGKVYTTEEIAKEIRPLPVGYEGTLRMDNVRFSMSGDVAVLSYDIPETLKLHGQTLHTHFRSTDVYRRLDDGWRLFAKQSLVIPGDLDPVKLDTRVYADYVGRYALGADAVLRVTREGDRLYSRRDERPKDELLPIGDDRFVRKGHPRGERFFRRGADGKVIALVDRRDNLDLAWKRIE